VEKCVNLSADGGYDARRAVADIGATDSAGEINVTVSIHILDDRSFRPRGEDWSGVENTARNRGIAPAHQFQRLGTRNRSA
jgi:hypothetical protein